MPYPRPPTTCTALQAEARRPPPLVEIIFEGNRSLSFDSEDHYMAYIGALARRYELAENERKANANRGTTSGSALPTTASPPHTETALPITPTTTAVLRMSPTLTERSPIISDSSPTSSSSARAVCDPPVAIGHSATINDVNICGSCTTTCDVDTRGPPTTTYDVDMHASRARNRAPSKSTPVEAIDVDAPSLDSLVASGGVDSSMEVEEAIGGPQSPRLLRPRRSLRLSKKGEACMPYENIHIYSSR
ncbi:hypothetical protein FA13DRAFT_1802431 [Coprinellus micaceus]|uniref:Uncharacterized protein n=1 Tax=Coprinellus micaceus TaxID=71717 RepID=A0A4Y7SCD1_COPMI|nr:hypothetical protein FA13DRAFT_1802431 [Coprinellus micaceus]